ncbi:hypothetical protein [Treponema sp.]|uniref:hypothetical protein n=1 Tax=Treponema sp. TaxID=166 RepID=UPI00298D8376|nr:hypothetical protein [Treponema sp.]MCR5614386.1 hypothetical protein [Treponema sp.]
MNNTSGIYVHSQTALPKEYANLLKEGSSVFVRILKESAPGRYLASFAGQRFEVRSKQALVPGSTFMAKIAIKNGRVNIVRSGEIHAPDTIQKTSAQNTKNIIQNINTMSGQMAELFLSLGLPADSVSKILLQTFVASGTKIDFDKVKKARAVALEFSGNEDEAAEAALILMEKGIEPTADNIRDLMMALVDGAGESLSGDGAGESQSAEEQSATEELFGAEESYAEHVRVDDKAGGEIAGLIAEVKEYFGALLEGKAEGDMPGGFLTVFNHMASGGAGVGKGGAEVADDADFGKDGAARPRFDGTHWVVLPFEFGFKRHEKVHEGVGVFRVFLDFLKKSARKFVVNFNIDGKLWTFVVSYKGECIKDVKFNCLPQQDQKTIEGYKEKLSSLLGGVSIHSESFENMAGFANGVEPLLQVKGFA